MQRILEKLITPDDLSGNAKHVLCETTDFLQVRITVHQKEGREYEERGLACIHVILFRSM
jgi:hypothetical protein